jgi:predicted RNA-binding Zn-ribbon protein involved in translation (DUF1610 family)
MGPVRCKQMIQREHYRGENLVECKGLMTLQVVYEDKAYFQCPRCGVVRSVKRELVER